MPVPAYNPYQFVPFPRDVPRSPIPPQAGHGSLRAKEFFCGKLTCTIHQETPILAVTRGPGRNNPPTALPASSLRGMVRSVAEMIGQGCGAFISKNGDMTYKDKKGGARNCRFPDPAVHVRCDRFPDNAAVLQEHEQAENRGKKMRLDWTRIHVCRTCAMFGFTLGELSWQGRVRFTDAPANRIFTRYDGSDTGVTLGSPMVHHRKFYFKAGTYNPGDLNEGGEMVGRKVYRHHGEADDLTLQIKDAVLWTSQGAGELTFDIYFENLSHIELGLLLFAVDLRRPGDQVVLRHHYGYGKPAGFGAIRIEMAGEQFPANRYRLQYRTGQLTPAYIEAVKRTFFERVKSETEVWTAFRQWFAWPPEPQADIDYPTFREFQRGLV